MTNMDSFNSVSEFVEGVPSHHRFRKPVVVSQGKFDSIYPRGSRIGDSGANISAYRVEDRPDVVIRKPIEAQNRDLTYTEAALIGRLTSAGLMVAEDGSVATKREEGSPCNLEDSSIDSREKRRILNFLKTTISDAHRVGGIVLDVKPDAILRDEDGALAKIDFNGCILLPEWSAITTVWRIRKSLKAVSNLPEQPPAKPDVDLKPSQLLGLIDNLRQAHDNAINDDDIVLRAFDLLSLNSLKKVISPQLRANLMKRVRTEYESIPIILRGPAKDRNLKILQGDKKLVLEIVDICRLSGIDITEPADEKKQTVSVSTPKVMRTDVRTIFQVLAIDDLLDDDPMAIMRLEGEKADNVMFVKGLYKELLEPFENQDELPAQNIEWYGKKITKLLEDLIKSYCSGILYDWNKYLNICSKNDDLYLEKPDYILKLSEKTTEMKNALAQGNYNLVRKLDLDFADIN